MCEPTIAFDHFEPTVICHLKIAINSYVSFLAFLLYALKKRANFRLHCPMENAFFIFKIRFSIVFCFVYLHSQWNSKKKNELIQSKINENCVQKEKRYQLFKLKSNVFSHLLHRNLRQHPRLQCRLTLICPNF